MRGIFIATILVFSTSSYSSEIYNCHYSKYSDGNNIQKADFKFSLSVDKKNSKAFVVGNMGKSEVVYVNKGRGQSFIEITSVGLVMTTTIDAFNKSVHSRNSIGPQGDIWPSQYYGSCKLE